MTTLFISDLHLDDKRPDATARFLEFLETEAADSEALYILGDLFEYWLGDDAPTPVGGVVAQALLKLNQSGVPLSFVHGNRDFLLGSEFASASGMKLLEEETVIDLYGRPTLLLHGDTLCTDDEGYQQVRKMLRNPQWQTDFLQKTPPERVQMAMEARELSAEYKQGVSMDIMDVNDTAVTDAFHRNNLHHMIHGHTHRPKVHQHELREGTGERIVLGDWYEQGSVLKVTAEGSKLACLPFHQESP